MDFQLTPNTSAWFSSIHDMLKNLPPSGDQLHLLDFSPSSIVQELQHKRPDIVQIERTTTLADDSIDAITAHSLLYHLRNPETFLKESRRILRPGGRLILFDPADGKPPAAALSGTFADPHSARSLYRWHRTALQYRRFTPEGIAQLLQSAGFVRILAEKTLDGWGLLSRGEKPYPQNISTVERVALGATDVEVRGKFIHLLIRQTPNKPIWKIEPGEELHWDAVALQAPDNNITVLGFTSLPKAVSFMQAAVMAGIIQDINKIAKFDKAIVAEWTFSLLLNPESLPPTHLKIFVSVDPNTAEAPDE